MFELIHRSGKSILKLNHRHPFIAQAHDAAKDAASSGAAELNRTEVKELLGEIDVALNVFMTAYAKAKNMNRDPDLA